MSSICRIVAVLGCGFALADCSMSMPSLDFLKGGPATEVLRIESEPPGADARTSLGQTCRTPCELTLADDADLAVTVTLAGYQPQTVPVNANGKGENRLQPNPLYVELQPAPPPPKPAKPAPVRKKPSAASAPPAQAAAPPPPPAQTQAAAPRPSGAFPSAGQGYPWPPAPQ